MIKSPLKAYVLDAYGGTDAPGAVFDVDLLDDSNPSLIFVHTVLVNADI
jgi:hypothetical protein